MSESITIARPYARVVFDIAKKGRMLNEWDMFLSNLSTVICYGNIIHFLKNRTVSDSEKSRIIIEFLDSQKIFNKDIYTLCVNFINVLSYYGRLLYIKDIYKLYKKYMNLELGCIQAVVKVAYKDISNYQKEYIIKCLSKRFGKKVSVLFRVDYDLLGGFLVTIDDFVLDASIAGNLVSLRTKVMV